MRWKDSPQYRWKLRNPDKLKAQNSKRWKINKKDKKWLEKHNKDSLERTRELRIRRRIELLEILGGHCNCQDKDCLCKGKCRIKDLDYITFDHINNDGNEDKIPIIQYPIYPELAKKKLNPLCANCHIYKTRKNEEWLCS